MHQLVIALTVFGLVFVGELPDKTAVASLVLGARYRPMPVFVGVATAFLLHVVLAVLVGGLLAQLPRTPVELVTGLLFLIGAVLLLWDGAPEPALLVITGALGLAMGAQAATARAIGVKDVTTVVITSTITGLAMDSPLAGGSGALWPRRLLAVLLMLAGAAVGAALLRVHAGAGLLVAGLICAAIAAIGHARCRG